MNFSNALFNIYGVIFVSENTSTAVSKEINSHSYCHVCSVEIKNPLNYLNHIAESHGEGPAIEEKSIPDVIQYTDLIEETNLDNMIVDINDPNFYCSLCDRKLSSKQSFKNHTQTKQHSEILESRLSLLSSNDPSYNYCKSCNRDYASNDMLLDHIENNHKKATFKHTIPIPKDGVSALSDISCELCNQVFGSELSLQFHMKKSHDSKLYTSKEPDDYCDICNFQCKGGFAYLAHIISRKHRDVALAADKSLTDSKSYPQSQVSFISSNDNIILESDATTKTNCEICKISFAFPSRFRHHRMSLSHRINSFLSTSQTGNTTSYNEVPEFETNCDALKLWSRQINYLTKHRTLLTKPKVQKGKGPKLISPRLNYSCNICDMRFISLTSSLCHLSSPTHKKNFLSSDNRLTNTLDITTSSEADSYLQHETKEGNEFQNNYNSDYRCDLCDISFHCTSYLKKHLLTAIHQKNSLIITASSTTKSKSKQSTSKLKKHPSCKPCNKLFLSSHHLKVHFTSSAHKKRLLVNSANIVDKEASITRESDSQDIFNTGYPNECVMNIISTANYHCKLCDVSYYYTSLLKNHLLTPEHKKRSLKVAASSIPECNSQPGISKLKKQAIKSYHCEPCNKSFEHPHHLENHTLISSVHKTQLLVNSSSAKIMDKEASTTRESDSQDVFNTGDSQESVIRTNSVANYHCELCDVSYYSPSVLKNHLLTQDHKENTMSVSTHATPDPVPKPNSRLKTQNYMENPVCIESVLNHKTISANKEPMIQTDTASNTACFDSDMHCNSCNMTFENKNRSLMHFVKMHKLNYPAPKETRNIKPGRKPSAHVVYKHDLLPDKNNPNFFCKACKIIFGNRGNYRLHLTSKHMMILSEEKSISSGDSRDAQPLTSTQVNVKPSLYCINCKLQYKTQNSYNTHLQKEHVKEDTTHYSNSTKETQIIELGIDLNPKLYCNDCKIQHENQEDYNSHLYKHSNKDLKIGETENGRLIKRKRIINSCVDIHSILYCPDCKFEFKDAFNYNAHLYMSHRLELKRNNIHYIKTEKREKPLIYRSCNFTYKNRASYNTHLRSYHKEELVNREIKQLSLAEVDDIRSVLHCDRCDFDYKSYYSYNRHLFDVHQVSKDELLELLSNNRHQINNSAKRKKMSMEKNCQMKPSDVDDGENSAVRLPAFKPTIKSLPNDRNSLENARRKSDNNVETRSGLKLAKKKPIKCDICQLELSSVAVVKHHRSKFHSVAAVLDPNRIYCNACQQYFTSANRYCRHAKQTHGLKVGETQSNH